MPALLLTVLFVTLAFNVLLLNMSLRGLRKDLRAYSKALAKKG